MFLTFLHRLSARKLWRDYFASGIDGVVFIVDAVDKERFPEAKRELDVRYFCFVFIDLLYVIFLTWDAAAAAHLAVYEEIA